MKRILHESRRFPFSHYWLGLLAALVMSNMMNPSDLYAQNSFDSKPFSTNVMGAEYPRIYPDLSAEFRVKAPGAQKLQIVLDKPYDMTKDTSGVWDCKNASIGSRVSLLFAESWRPGGCRCFQSIVFRHEPHGQRN